RRPPRCTRFTYTTLFRSNPIEQEGTFPLPEAQLDRFLMYVRIGYPEAEAEGEILRLARERARQGLQAEEPTAAKIAQDDVFAARSEEHTSELQSRENLVC